MFDRATEKNSQGPCPFRAEGICTGDDCVMWNDDVSACGLSPISLHLLMKTAVADASVEVMQAMSAYPDLPGSEKATGGNTAWGNGYAPGTGCHRSADTTL